MPCHREHVTGSIPFLQRTQAHSWCAKYAGILPSSLVSQEFSAGLYRGDQMGGLILAPPPLNRIFCAYPGDGNSMGNLLGRLHPLDGAQALSAHTISRHQSTRRRSLRPQS